MLKKSEGIFARDLYVKSKTKINIFYQNDICFVLCQHDQMSMKYM